MNAKGGFEHNVKNKIKIAWQKWIDLTNVLCDANSSQGKGIQDNYKTTIRQEKGAEPVMRRKMGYWREQK